MLNNSCEQKYQTRSILHSLGVQLWAARTSQTQVLDKQLAQPLALAQPVISSQAPPTASPVLVKAEVVSQSPKQPIGSQLSKLQQTLKQHSQQAQNHNPSASLTDENADMDTPISFKLQAVIYQQWLLLVDFDSIELAVKDVWLSLQSAIQNHAKTVQLTYEMRTLNYPIIANDARANQPAVINASVQGFIFGCLRSNTKIEQIFVLSKLPDYLNLENLLDTLGVKPAINLDYQLDAMHKHPDQKKVFWQSLHPMNQ